MEALQTLIKMYPFGVFAVVLLPLFVNYAWRTYRNDPRSKRREPHD